MFKAMLTAAVLFGAAATATAQNAARPETTPRVRTVNRAPQAVENASRPTTARPAGRVEVAPAVAPQRTPVQVKAAQTATPATPVRTTTDVPHAGDRAPKMKLQNRSAATAR